MAETNGTYKIAKLSDGREVKVDVELARASMRKVRDVRAINQLVPLSDAHFAFFSKLTGLSQDEMLDMDTEDFQKVDAAVGEALKEVTGPN